MTERTPEERASRLNEDDPEVEGHKFRDSMEPSEAGRFKLQDQDDDEGPDVEGHKFR